MKLLRTVVIVLLVSLTSARAQNTDPQAVKFTNEKIRVAADKMIQAMDFCKVVVDEWNATSMSSNIPNDGVLIHDGCQTDGRPCITNANATTIITRCQEMDTYLNGGGTLADVNRLDTIVKPSVNRANASP